MNDLVLHVANNLGKNTMVGKVLADDPPLFFHEGTPSQYFRMFASPGGVDAAVVSYCRSNGIEDYYHVIKKGEEIKHIYHAPMSVVESSPRRKFDGRDRFFPPVEVLGELADLPFEDRWIKESEWL